MRSILHVIVLGGVCLAWGSGVKAQDKSYRPCGPCKSQGGNWLIPQGVGTADFRPACEAHDNCTLPDRQCDEQFLNNMLCACQHSDKPWLCRMRARHYYFASRMYHILPPALRPTYWRQ